MTADSTDLKCLDKLDTRFKYLCGHCLYKNCKLFHDLNAKEQLLFLSCLSAFSHPLKPGVSANQNTAYSHTTQNFPEIFMHIIHIARPH